MTRRPNVGLSSGRSTHAIKAAVCGICLAEIPKNLHFCGEGWIHTPENFLLAVSSRPQLKPVRAMHILRQGMTLYSVFPASVCRNYFFRNMLLAVYMAVDICAVTKRKLFFVETWWKTTCTKQKPERSEPQELISAKDYKAKGKTLNQSTQSETL